MSTQNTQSKTVFSGLNKEGIPLFVPRAAIDADHLDEKLLRQHFKEVSSRHGVPMPEKRLDSRMQHLTELGFKADHPDMIEYQKAKLAIEAKKAGANVAWRNPAQA